MIGMMWTRKQILPTRMSGWRNFDQSAFQPKANLATGTVYSLQSAGATLHPYVWKFLRCYNDLRGFSAIFAPNRST
ncbi:hypothetical protein CAK95_12420 [Pseudorhodoplanes sinuspersici]|uniref:Uncharacterized protein n=1 Tax=Pseudorhodoplanes sinuspersici TaxID=1235591 RepID=A0A1W6ZRC6_9HYPH|nr:hypothetical protein CAK95_12420 [Pseudorhodoplanes sinuspersici]